MPRLSLPVKIESQFAIEEGGYGAEARVKDRSSQFALSCAHFREREVKEITSHVLSQNIETSFVSA